MSGVEVRALVPSEAGAWVALRREMLADSAWAFASSPQDDAGLDPRVAAARLGEPFNAICGAWEGGRLVGSAGVLRERHVKLAHKAWIVGVYVTSSHRGRGVGRAVVEGAIGIARGWAGVEAVLLSVSERSPAARALYESLGFTAWGVEPDCLRLDGERLSEVHMRMALEGVRDEA